MNKNRFLSFTFQHQPSFFLFLTAIFGIYIIWPLNNFQFYLSPLDHGRDLYCFKRTLDGALPYQDYSWIYGPLMPYYFATFLHLFGVKIQSVLLGQNILIFFSGILIYFTCTIFTRPLFALICALWYWSFRQMEFFYTYHHNGAILLLFLLIYFLIRYIFESKKIFVYGGFLTLFFLFLVKFNIGFATLAGFSLSLFWTDSIKKERRENQNRQTFFLIALLLGSVFFVYWLFLHPLPTYVVSQAFPYLPSQRISSSTLPEGLIFLLKTSFYTFTGTLARKVFAIFLGFCLLRFILRKEDQAGQKKNFLLSMSCLFVMMALSLHEFIFSETMYTLNWGFPFFFILLFFIVEGGLRNLSFAIRILAAVTLFYIAVLQLNIYRENIISFKNPAHLIEIEENKVYTTQLPEWKTILNQTLGFLKSSVSPRENLLIADSPLYYFLSGRKSPIRELEFTKDSCANQGNNIIRILEQKPVHWILFTNWSSKLKDEDEFGVTYCQEFKKYIDGHYKEAAIWGNWKNPPGWAEDHGTKFLKRAVE